MLERKIGRVKFLMNTEHGQVEATIHTTGQPDQKVLVVGNEGAPRDFWHALTEWFGGLQWERPLREQSALELAQTMGRCEMHMDRHISEAEDALAQLKWARAQSGLPVEARLEYAGNAVAKLGTAAGTVRRWTRASHELAKMERAEEARGWVRS